MTFWPTLRPNDSAPAGSSAAPNDHVVTTSPQAVGPGSGSSRRSNDSRSCCCPTATSLSADDPWPRLVLRADAAPCVLRNSSLEPVPSDQWWQLTQDEALLRLTRSIRPGALSLSIHCRAYSAQTALPLDCSLRCHSLPKHTCIHEHGKFLCQPVRHVRFTCTKSPDRHTVDLTAIHVPMHSCPHVASENNNETDRLT